LEPEWFNSEAKYCISREFNGDGSYSFNINLHYKLFRFLAFKTREDAEVFLNIASANAPLACSEL
jgi:hypothetical protein